jgi:hypothetical protein
MSIWRALKRRLAWFASFIATLLLLYILTAPPIISAHGDGLIPAFYKPLMDVAYSSFGAPMFWYFNSIWNTHLIVIGQAPDLSWFVMIVYCISCIAILAVICLPVVTYFRWRSHAA